MSRLLASIVFCLFVMLVCSRSPLALAVDISPADVEAEERVVEREAAREEEMEKTRILGELEAEQSRELEKADDKEKPRALSAPVLEEGDDEKHLEETDHFDDRLDRALHLERAAGVQPSARDLEPATEE